MHQVEGALQFAIANKPVWGIHIARLGKPIPSALTIPSLWCSPDNMPPSHAGDHRSKAGQGRHFRRVVRGEKKTHLIQNQAALGVQVVSRRPAFAASFGLAGQFALKAFPVMHSLGRRVNSAQIRVRAPSFRRRRPQSSQRSSGFHKPAASGAAPETARPLACRPPCLHAAACGFLL